MVKLRQLKAWAGKVLAELGISAEADIFLLSDSEMNRLRKRLTRLPGFRGPEAQKIKEETAVNVLALPAGPDFPQPRNAPKRLGEVYINVRMVKSDPDAAAYLVIHGILHLLGYEHLKKHARIKMESLEKELFLRVFSH